MNLTMREFEEIGSAVSDLASDDATVVIGTVIDPEIGDELRVTVVATGLGGKPVKKDKPVERIEKPIRVVRNGTTGQPDPAYMDGDDHQRGASPYTGQQTGSDNPDLFSQGESIDYLDIPAFLRNQAD